MKLNNLFWDLSYYFSFYSVRNVALLVQLMVQFLDLLISRLLVAGKSNLRPQYNFSD